MANRKPKAKGKLQLVNGVELFQKMRKSLGNKRNELGKGHIETLAKTYGEFRTSEVSGEDVSSIILVVPPISEQRAIVTWLETAERRVQSLLTTVRLQVDKLREYRQALITAAVTGKIDLSSEAAA